MSNTIAPVAPPGDEAQVEFDVLTARLPPLRLTAGYEPRPVPRAFFQGPHEPEVEWDA